MRTAEGEATPTSSARLRGLLIGVLAAITAVGAVLPWLALADGWGSAVDDAFLTEAEVGWLPQLAFAVQALPFRTLQAGNHDVLVMGAAVAVIVLVRRWSWGSEEGMRWPPALVVTGIAVVVSLMAALLRLAAAVYTQVGLMEEWIEQYFMLTGGMGGFLVVLGTAVTVLGWFAVLLAGYLFRPLDEGEDEPDEDDGSVDDMTRDHAHEPVREQPQAPAQQTGPAEIRADGASDSGYDEFRFRR